MKYQCNAVLEGRSKCEPERCNHRGQHGVMLITGISSNSYCTEERFCEVQNEMVYCVGVALFPNMKNPITIPDDLAKEFVDWAKSQGGGWDAPSAIVKKLAERIEKQLLDRRDNDGKG